jgi:hypothetical protein
MSAVQAFPKKVNDCIDGIKPTGIPWENCAYTVTFMDYATIAEGDTNIGAQALAMGVLIDYHSGYERLLAQIPDMQARPELYEKSSVNLSDLSSRITASKKLAETAANACNQTSSECTAPSGLLDPNGVALPARKLLMTRTCADYKTNYPSVSADGEYRMYFETDAELKKPFYLYCLGMNTATPKEYLTLKLTSPASTSPSYNFASSVGHGDAYTVFTKVGVAVNPSELAIVRNDFQYSTTTWVWNGCPAETSCDRQAQYGQTIGLYPNMIAANLDFTDTPFAVSDATEWVPTGSSVISSDRKSVNLPGNVMPKADIRLKSAQ